METELIDKLFLELSQFTKAKPYSGRRSVRAKTSWVGTNLATGRQVQIRSAAKLRLDITPPTGFDGVAQ